MKQLPAMYVFLDTDLQGLKSEKMNDYVFH